MDYPLVKGNFLRIGRGELGKEYGFPKGRGLKGFLKGAFLKVFPLEFRVPL